MPHGCPNYFQKSVESPFNEKFDHKEKKPEIGAGRANPALPLHNHHHTRAAYKPQQQIQKSQNGRVYILKPESTAQAGLHSSRPKCGQRVGGLPGKFLWENLKS